MHLVLLGGAPGVGKTTVARSLLVHAIAGPKLVQWVDVDALWLHQPWRVDDRMKQLVQRNLAAVLANAADAGVDVVVVTWVFQDAGMHDLVRSLAPPVSGITTVQLLADEDAWRARIAADPLRPPVDDFFIGRYRAAQATPADRAVDTSDRPANDVAAEVAALIAT